MAERRQNEASAFAAGPRWPQRQDSLMDQMRDVLAMANRTGCYDAADAIRSAFFDAPASRGGPSVPPTREELFNDG